MVNLTRNIVKFKIKNPPTPTNISIKEGTYVELIYQPHHYHLSFGTVKDKY